MKKIIAVLVISIIISISLCSCENKEDKIANDDVVIINPQEEEDKAQDVNEDNGSNDSESGSKDVSSNLNSGNINEIPEKFPLDILPLMEGAEITRTSSLKGEGGTVIYTVKQSIQDVYDFYKPKLERLDKFNEAEDDAVHYFYAKSGEYGIVVSLTPIDDNSVEVLLNARL